MVANSVEAAIAVAFISLFLLQLLIRFLFWSTACSAYDNDSDDASDAGAGAAAGRIKMMRQSRRVKEIYFEKKLQTLFGR